MRDAGADGAVKQPPLPFAHLDHWPADPAEPARPEGGLEAQRHLIKQAAKLGMTLTPLQPA